MPSLCLGNLGRLCCLTLCGIASFAGADGAARTAKEAPDDRVLVFTRTLGWRHASIPAGVAALERLGAESGFAVDATEDPSAFSEENLARYGAVVFLSTTGNVLAEEQQVAFERYIQAGGGFMGVHAAADTEYDWPWYNGLVGAHFASHPNLPNVRAAEIDVLSKDHPSTEHLPDRWARVDEWYNYGSFYPGIDVLAELDESTYGGGTHGKNHPIVWFHEYDGGRAFYTGGGHTEESYSEPDFLRHLAGGLRYAMGDGQPLDFGRSYAELVPEENRFEKTVLVEGLASPMEVVAADDGRIFYTELDGKVSVFDPNTGRAREILSLEVARSGGTGLIGIALDPQFGENDWIYLYHARPVDEPPIPFHLSRFTLGPDGKLDPASEKVLLEVPVSWSGGSHHGGSMAWDREGNLYLSTGDSTAPHPAKGYAPLDERPAADSREQDAQRSAANSMDLRGKILRIKPLADGSYEIPEGNLFPPGTPKTRPEIYVMGTRNPYRIAVNPETGALYWGDIGPDAGQDSERGPRGYDEFNQALEAGNYGWPHAIGDNYAYSRWNYGADAPGPLFNPEKPINRSPNNAGIEALPPAKEPLIWYPYDGSERFPELGEGGRSAMVGAFYRYDANRAAADALPDYFDGALFVFDWMRNWIKALRFDSQQSLEAIQPFMDSNGDFRRPIDLTFDSAGRMVLLEYGSVYGIDNVDARLVRIGFNSGNRAPRARARIADPEAYRLEDERSALTSDRRRYRTQRSEASGSVPLTVTLIGEADDPDQSDALRYLWDFGDGSPPATTARVDHTYRSAGEFTAQLTVTDSSGAESVDAVTIVAGNARPNVSIETPANRSFFQDGQRLAYRVVVEDDGLPIDRDRITVDLRYDAQPVDGTDPIGAQLIAQSDCRACHQEATASVGPSYLQIAERYREQPGAKGQLVRKVIEGGGGVWSENLVMSAHPQLASEDVEAMVDYILDLDDRASAHRELPAQGTIALDLHGTDEPLGRYLISASYQDDGGDAGVALTGEDRIELRPSAVPAETVDAYPGFNRWGRKIAWGGHKAALLLRDINLRRTLGVKVDYTAPTPGEIELRQHSFNGPLIGRARFEVAEQASEVTLHLDGPFDEEGDLYFVMLQPEQPENWGMTVMSLEFLVVP